MTEPVMHFHRIDSTCPFCGIEFGWAACGATARHPKPGDLSVCLHCATAIRYGTPNTVIENEDLRKLPTHKLSELLVHQSLAFELVQSPLKCSDKAGADMCRCGHPKSQHSLPCKLALGWTCDECDCELFELERGEATAQ